MLRQFFNPFNLGLLLEFLLLWSGEAFGEIFFLVYLAKII